MPLDVVKECSTADMRVRRTGMRNGGRTSVQGLLTKMRVMDCVAVYSRELCIHEECGSDDEENTSG